MKARLDPHAKYRELLSARLDRPLTRAENRVVVAHLKTCAECRQAERDYLDQRSLLRSMPPLMPPRDMWARTSTALDREVTRWSYRYPRFGRRRVPLGDTRSRSGSPGALATAVAALGIVSVLAIVQLAPNVRPTPGLTDGGSVAAPPRPTPFAVAPQPLTLFAAGQLDFSVYETQVTQVCPATEYDCFDDESLVRRRVALSAEIHPQNIALSPSGGNFAAFVGRDADADVIGVVMLNSDAAPPEEPAPTDEGPIASNHGGTPKPVATSSASAGSSVDHVPPGGSTSPSPSGKPTATPAKTTNSSGDLTSPEPIETADSSVDPSPAVEPSETPVVAVVETPPASVVPGLTVLSILEDVHSAGAPPAWSRDGSLLAFSAMPADGSHGPDVYLWSPGDAHAHAVTTDHDSFFASWSGRRIVLSRLDDSAGKSDSVDVLTIVMDPSTLEERVVDGPQMWLPVVDPQRSSAVVWHGKVDRDGALPVLRSGGLYLIDWTALNPFRESPAEPEPATEPSAQPGDDAQAEPKLVALDAGRDPIAHPVLDWQVRWSGDGRVLGVWETDALNGSWGLLELFAFDPATGRLDRGNSLIGEQFAKRGFTLGVDRVAWVGARDEGAEGELKIRTWGDDGVGGLRMEALDLEDLVPAF